MSGAWLSLADEADASEEGLAEVIVEIDSDPFQLIALPLYLPRQVASIIGGFALDQNFVERVKETIVSEVSIIRRSDGSNLEVVASTLSTARQQILAEQMPINWLAVDSLQRISLEGEEFTTLLRSLFGSSSDELQVLAIIQRSYDENNENVVQFRTLLIEFYAVIIAISLIAVVFLSRSIT